MFQITIQTRALLDIDNLVEWGFFHISGCFNENVMQHAQGQRAAGAPTRESVNFMTIYSNAVTLSPIGQQKKTQDGISTRAFCFFPFLLDGFGWIFAFLATSFVIGEFRGEILRCSFSGEWMYQQSSTFHLSYEAPLPNSHLSYTATPDSTRPPPFNRLSSNPFQLSGIPEWDVHGIFRVPPLSSSTRLPLLLTNFYLSVRWTRLQSLKHYSTQFEPPSSSSRYTYQPSHLPLRNTGARYLYGSTPSHTTFYPPL